MPASDEPWFVNGVVQVATQLGPAELLALLHQIEADFEAKVKSEFNKMISTYSKEI